MGSIIMGMFNSAISKLNSSIKEKFQSPGLLISGLIAAIPNLLGWVDLIEKILRNLVPFFIVIGVLAISLIWFYLVKNRPNGQAVSNLNMVKPNYSFLFRILSFIFIFIFILLVSSLYYLKSRPIYYLIPNDHITLTQAIAKKNIYDSLFESKSLYGFSASIRNHSRFPSENNYFISFNGGYISFSNAKRDSALIKDLFEKKVGIIKLRSSTTTSFPRKIEYLARHTKSILF